MPVIIKKIKLKKMKIATIQGQLHPSSSPYKHKQNNFAIILTKGIAYYVTGLVKYL